MDETLPVIVVGGGFAGVKTATQLGRKGIDVLLIDKNNYHQFQPLLYQVATAQIGVSEVARPFRAIFRRSNRVRVVTAEVTAIDPAGRSVTTSDGATYRARILVLAAGAVPNFFDTPGAEEFAHPLYSVIDAVSLGANLTSLLDHADKETAGDVNIVVIGGGPTGVETAGAIAENVKFVLPSYFSSGLAARCHVYLVDMVPTVLNAFSEKSQSYARKRLVKVGVRLQLGVGVTEVSADAVTLADGTVLPSRIVVWAGGLKAGAVLASSGLAHGRGGRIDVQPDLTARDFEGVYVLGDAANMTDTTGAHLPQLGSVAQQSGKWAARNIHADLTGGKREPFRYFDKGYMAMIGRGAAVAEIGRKRVQIQGPLAFAAWLGVHAALLSGGRQKIGALISWIEDFVSHERSQVIVGPPE
ncbi:NAD(P)/FAD-dependent oxidoreductase [Arthrobacter sp. CG_A4]|uniref:NAD(P)/FAD-dependent oxidoreductase n=1 Tax=Arthrobacter sp. CG_A4 TaxID=3071706 RepID=UPI002E1291FB